jgi:HK97 family phage prohead protease
MSERRSWELRHLVEGGDGTARLSGIAVPFGKWTEVNSKVEGHFLERFVRGAFTQTLKEDRAHMRVLFQHGQDAVVGLRPIASIERLEETARGLEFEVALLDTNYNKEILPGIERNQYGVSVSFKVMAEHLERNPLPSRYNPAGIPERTVQGARLFEFSVVTFAQYKDTAVSVSGRAPRWYLRQPIPSGPYLPEVVRVRAGSEPWRLGRKAWELPGSKRRPKWRLS